MDHVMAFYPERGRLRSSALRKLSESLNDLMGHAEVVRISAGEHSIVWDKPDESTPAQNPNPTDRPY